MNNSLVFNVCRGELDSLQYLEQVVPYYLHCRYVEPLLWCVYATECGAEADHVKIRIALREETALQSGVYAEHFRLSAE